MKTMIAIPCMDSVRTQFMTSLMSMRRVGDIQLSVVAQSLIYDARNELSINAITSECDRVLWLDSDMRFDSDLLERLMRDIDDYDMDAVTGLYFQRSLPTKPIIYSEITVNDTPDENLQRIHVQEMLQYPRDQLFRVAGFGFGCVLMKTDLLKAVWEKYGPPFTPVSGIGEDLSFCWRANQLSKLLFCDSSIKAGHIGMIEYNERTWDSQRRGDNH